ncbi:MAG: hypothetical protein O7G88_20210 [bacterium]|nr:hypothetical protein [bacterium]
MDAEQPLQMCDALLPLVGEACCQQLLARMYDREVLRAADIKTETICRVDAFIASHGVEAMPRREVMLESDSKSRIFVVHTQLSDSDSFTLVVKWYNGSRQRLATVEQQMNTYFQQRLAPYCAVGPILAVVPLMAIEPLSVAIMPYLGDTTLYDYLHQMPRHSPQVETLLCQASDTLAAAQVLGRLGHEEQAIHLTNLASEEEATAYFLYQIDSVLLQTLSVGSQASSMANDLLEPLTFFAAILGADSCTAGLYYRGINPRNIMWFEGQQIEIDFEQETLRSRYIDIVTLLENGLEMTHWDAAADYPCFDAQTPFVLWDARRQWAWDVLAQYNYLNHHQVEALTESFLATTSRFEQQYLASQRPTLSRTQRRLLLETARLFRHLQYVGYCKRNEQQALTAAKRLSSQYRQQFHALWAKCTLDRLLYPQRPADKCLPDAGREAALALRRTLDGLPIG